MRSASAARPGILASSAARALVLRAEEGLRFRRLHVLHPAIGIDHLHAVQRFAHLANRRQRPRRLGRDCDRGRRGRQWRGAATAGGAAGAARPRRTPGAGGGRAGMRRCGFIGRRRRLPRRTAGPRGARRGRPRGPSDSCVPVATMRPWSMTTMRSADFTVARRWAMMSVVAPAHEAGERQLHAALAFRVERAGGLVEQQHGAVGEDRARDGDALALPAGELHAALAQRRGESLRQALRRTRGSRRAGRPRAPASSVASGLP